MTPLSRPKESVFPSSKRYTLGTKLQHPHKPRAQEYDAYQDYSPPALEAYRAWLRSQVGWGALPTRFAVLLLLQACRGVAGRYRN